MSKNTDKTEQAAPAQPVEDSYALTLDEFCKQLSTKDKRVSLIGGFYASEKSSGKLKDTVANYSARYQAFSQQPA